MLGSAALRTSLAPGGALAGPWVRNELWTRARAVPSLDLRFAENKSLVDATTGAQLVTFTRASSGTYVDSQGVIRTATTNLLLRSEEFDNASWAKTLSTVTANAAVAPNGSISADKLIGNSTVDQHYAQQNVSGTINGISYTSSVYAKASEITRIEILHAVGSTLYVQGYDLSNGTLLTRVTPGTTAATGGFIQSVGDGWYRCGITQTSDGTSGAMRITLRSVNTVNFDAASQGVLLFGAQLEQSSTVGEYIPTTSTINSAPRFDHNPTTGESLGLLVEEARTNSIRNNTMVGAVAGTPGTLPTNWGTDTLGLTREIVGTGTQNGINYIDIRISGTSSAAYGNIFFDGSTGIAATNNQAWAHSLWLSVAAGSTTNISTIRQAFDLYSSGGAYLATVTSNLTGIASTLSRFSAVLTTNNASTAFVRPSLSLLWSNGAAIDITLRIGLPQLEQGAFAASVIPTTGTAATRSADVASISGSNFSGWYRQDEGTVFASAQRLTNVADFNRLLSFNTGTTNDVWSIYSSANKYDGYKKVAAGADNFLGGAAVGTLLNNHRVAAATNASSLIMATDGVLSSEGAFAGMPAVNRLAIGSEYYPAYLNGTISRLTYWPQRLSNNVLQAITQ